MTHNVAGFTGDASGFSRNLYDRCSYQKDIFQSVEPLGYMLYPGMYENIGKCVVNKNQFWRPFDEKIIDADSELKNITRRATRCPQYKYSPTCKKSCFCTSTFDPSNPIVMAQEACPIVRNNIPRNTNVGYKLRTEPFCMRN